MTSPLLLLLILGLSPPAPGAEQSAVLSPETLTPQQVRASIERAVGFLLQDQNADGSWGSHRNAAHGFWSNPETHRSWIVATTGLCCMALREAGPTAEAEAAYDRGLDYLLENALVKRPSGWDVDNTWAYVYGLQALARACADPREATGPRRQEIRRVAQALVQKLADYQTDLGGWGYYDSWEGATRRPTWATSFMTAVGVLALLDSQEAHLEVDPGMLRRAVRAVRRSRLPSGAYTYSVEVIPSPGWMEGIDQIKGSLSRIQVCNLALLKAGQDVTSTDLSDGLGHFFKEHRFLDIARMKPYPHEAYYQNSGYFYFFGHYYAAEVIGQLPREQRAKWWPKLQYEILKTQGQDGAMWDFYINTYHKPYAVAYSLLALAPSLRDQAAATSESGPDTAGPN